LGQTRPRRSGANIGPEECWVGVDPKIFFFYVFWIGLDSTQLFWFETKLSSPLNSEEALHYSITKQWSNRRRRRKRRRGEVNLGVVMLLLTMAHEAGVWASWGGKRERRLQGKFLLLYLPCASRGRRRSTILLKWHCSAFFFNLCEHYMKWRPFAQNTLLHLKGNGAKNISNSK